jgi:phosphoenolpyruvate-protein kinase (PTS system EI component)
VKRLADELSPDHRPQLGAMIETPSALFCLPEVLRQVDFASIGTNDLTQFMLAVDRDTADLSEEHSVIHPAVLRAIRHVVQQCASVGCRLSVCGEAAGDVRTAGLLVGLGVRELSMSPIRAARVRLGIRESSASELASVADRALESDTAASVSVLLNDFWHDALWRN